MYRRRPTTLVHWLSTDRVCWVCSASRFTGTGTGLPASDPRTVPGRHPLSTSTAATKVKIKKPSGEEEWLVDSKNISEGKKFPLNLRQQYEKGQRLRFRRPATDTSEFAPLDEVLLEQRLNAILSRPGEKESGGESDLTEAINFLKPEATRVSEERLEQLKQELDRGFKAAQLRKYLHRDFITKGMKKHIVINRILSKQWKIESGKEINPSEDVVHKKTVESDRVRLFFIIGEGGNNIRNLANSTGAKITVQLGTRSLELSGTAESIEKCANAVNDITKDITQEDFDVTPILRVAQFDGSLIGPISRATSTFIEKVDEKTLRIYTSGPKKQSRADDAKRLLLNSFDLFGQHSRYSLLCETGAKKTVKAALFTVTENQSLPLRFRASHWSRWRSVREKPSGPTARAVADAIKSAELHKRAALKENADAEADTLASSSEKTPLSLIENGVGEEVVEEAAAAEMDGLKIEDENAESADAEIPSASEEDGLARDDEEVIESSFQRLRPGTYAASSEASKNVEPPSAKGEGQGVLSDASALKRFLDHGHEQRKTPLGLPVEVEYHSYIGHVVHSAPASNSQEYTSLPALIDGNYSRLFINTVPHINDAMVRLKPYRISTRFVVQFSPSPWAQSANFENLPKVELELETNPVDGELSRPVLTATLYETAADVLLPDKAADVRFMRKEVLRLDEKHANVERYIAESKLNPTKYARFTAPPSIQISLPSELFPVKKGTKLSKQEERFTTVEYYFTGLEHHSSFLYRWANQDLLYSKIEGGAAGARFQEVRLKCNTAAVIQPPAAQTAGDDPEALVEGQAERVDEWWMSDEDMELDRPELVMRKQSLGFGKSGRNPNRWNVEEFHKAAHSANGEEFDKAAEPVNIGHSDQPSTKPGARDVAMSGDGKTLDGKAVLDEAENARDAVSTSTPLDSFTQFVTATRRVLSLIEKSTSRSVL